MIPFALPDITAKLLPENADDSDRKSTSTKLGSFLRDASIQVERIKPAKGPRIRVAFVPKDHWLLGAPVRSGQGGQGGQPPIKTRP